MRGSFGYVATWWRCITTLPRLAGVHAIIAASPFAPLVSLAYDITDHGIIIGLVERWFDTTHTFHFPCGEIGLTPLDFTMITEMSIGVGETIPFDANYGRRSEMLRLLPRLTEAAEESKCVKLSHLITHYLLPMTLKGTPFEIVPRSEGERQYARVFLLWFLGQCLLPQSRSTVPIGFLSGLIDIGAMHTYDWGGAIFCHTYHALDIASRNVTARTPSIACFHPWLQIWFYEYVHVMTPLYDSAMLDGRDIRLRFLQWSTLGRQRARHETHHNYHIARNMIDIRSVASIRWRPWEGSQHLTDPVVIWATTLSRQRVIFCSHETRIQYLRDRCWRQATGLTAIPMDPPEQMRGLDVLQVHWLQYGREYGWPEGADACMSATDEVYAHYWRRVSLGCLLSEFSRPGIIDLIGRPAIRPELDLPGPSQPFTSDSTQSYQGYRSVPQPAGDVWSHYRVVGLSGAERDVHISVPPVTYPCICTRFS